MSRTNYILMFIMLISCISMFSFFPFLVTIMTGHYAITAANVGIMMSVGIIAGNLSSVIICMFLSEKLYKPVFTLSLIAFSISTFGFFFVSSISSTVYQYIILLCCIVLYRFSVGAYYNISRVYQIHSLSKEHEKLKLFSNIKFVNSIGGGLGPVIGQTIINYGGDNALFIFCSVTFLLASMLVLLFVPSVKKSQQAQFVNVFHGMMQVVCDKAFVLLSFGSLFHYIFEAQIYTFITLKIKENHIHNGVAYIFTLNSIFLVILAFLGGKFIRNIDKFPKISILAFGSFCSCMSLISTPLVTSYVGLAFVAFIFSLGEYLVPQLAVNLITDTPENTLQRITLFNFMTNAIGLGIGFIIGSYLSTVDNLVATAASWLSILVLVCLLFSLGLSASRAQNTTLLSAIPSKK